LWHRGRCLSYGDGIAFWALAEIVRQRLGIGEEDPTEVAAHKLCEGMARFVPDEDEREYVAVRLSRLLGVPYGACPDPEVVMSRDELFAGWRLFLERLAAIAPVVMLVEDAHHADVGLLAFFDHLIEWARSAPLFVLLFARPGMASIDSGYAVGRNRSTLSLDPLDDASMESIVESLVPGMPAHARRAIAARAEGVPLFAVETVRSLVDRGLVDRGADGVCRLSGDIGTMQVPQSLHGLLAARLDAVPQPARKLLAVASVLGTSFQEENLAAVSKEGAAAVAGALGELVKRGVLEIFADPLSPERGAYRFGQEMLRQVAYEALSRRDRKSLHLAVASHLRSVYPGDGETIADVIARHYLDAMAADAGGPEAEALRAQAVEFLVRAAERARRSGAPARAAETFE
ncbi:MAG: ATP-binding protein, partial [Solirubrobacteraceae bacterium]